MSSSKSLVNITLGLAMLCAYAAPAGAQAIISNGTGIALGVDTLGQLNVPDGTGGVTLTPRNSGFVGLYSFALDADATSPGCLCEGFGVSVNGVVTGFADNSTGTAGLTSVSFASTASTATAVTRLSGIGTAANPFLISQFYHPSASPDLFQVDVTLTNNTGAAVTDVRYNRTMDWDVPPTTFDELVTIQGWPATALICTGDDGFQSPNPLVACDSISAPLNTNFEDNPAPLGADHGARFTFGFGPLGIGASKSFTIFYGASLSERSADLALAAVGAEVFSYGECTFGGSGGPTPPPCGPIGSGTPSTFIFGFAGVGGTPVSAVPEPASLMLLGTGLIGAIRYRRRSNK